MSSEPKIYVPEFGVHNRDLEESARRLDISKTYRDLSTVIICPTRGLIPSRVVQSWLGLMKPMNQKVIGPIFAVGMEVGEAYNNLVSLVLNNPELSKWKYILTIEEDNVPPADGLLKLYESMDKYDVVQGLYWTKGEGGQPMCFDNETEVLTKIGWKFFKDITFNDEIATINTEGYIEYHLPLAKQVYDYSGDMIVWKGQCYNTKVTPDHMMYCSTRDGRPFIRIAAQEVENRRKLSFKKDALWNGDEIDVYKINGIIEAKMDNWLEFLGYYLSEGYCPNRINKNSNLVDIRQNEGKVYDLIVNVIKRLGITPNLYTGKASRIQFCNYDYHNELIKFGKAGDKYIPDYVKKLSTRQIKIFLDAIWRGGGNFKNGLYMVYTTKSKKLADDIQELLLKIGLVGTIGMVKNKNIYRVSVTNRNLTPRVTKKSYREFYSGKIYDLTVPNHTMYVRRHGNAIWSGNCYGDPNIFPKNFIPQKPIPETVMACNGLGMGFNLFKIDIFKNKDLQKPWFKTVQEVTTGGVRAYTQDLYFYENASKCGYRFACDTRVKVGHYSYEQDIVW